MFETVQCLLGSELVGFFFAVALGVTGMDSTHDDGGAEYGVLVTVGGQVNELKLDRDMILLCPLDES